MDKKTFEGIGSLFDLSGRVAVITGAAGGLGQIIAFALAAFGAHAVLASRNIDNLEELKRKIEDLGGEALAVATDISQADQVDQMVSATIDRFEKIDILVNNSGVQIREPAEDMTLESWHKAMETNVTGTFLCSQRVGRVMIPRKRGKIINISSIRGKLGRSKDFISYCSSKGAIDAMTRALACEWGKHNIQVNAIAPSLIETELTRHSLADPNWLEAYMVRVPAKRWGQPMDLAGSIIYFASDASNYINGQVLYLDGGYGIA